MFDEDNAIGLSVWNGAGDSWRMYGGRRALSLENADNMARCVAAVQASADEIYDAYLSKRLSADYAAWNLAPTLRSARGHQQHAPLFTFLQERRKDISKRQEWAFETRWWFPSTFDEAVRSGRWWFPIGLNKAAAIPGTSLAVTSSPRNFLRQVYYQSPDGGISETIHMYQPGSEGTKSQSCIFRAVPFTPLAAVSWDTKEDAGREVRSSQVSCRK